MGIFSKRLLKEGRFKYAYKKIAAMFALICEGVANLL